MKKILLTIVLMTLLCLAIGSKDAIAATGLSEGERVILERMEMSVIFSDQSVKLPVSYINQIENEFIKNETDITIEQADVVIEKIDKAMKIIESVKFEDISKMKNVEVIFQLLQLIEEAVSEINYKISINLNEPGINITDPEGKLVMITKGVINQTGIGLSPAVVMELSFVLILIIYVSIFSTYIVVSLYKKRDITDMKMKRIVN